MPGFLHRLGVYFGIAELTEAERHAADVELRDQTTRQIGTEAAAYGLLLAAGWALITAAFDGFDVALGRSILPAVLFGTAMGVVRVVATLASRNRALERQGAFDDIVQSQRRRRRRSRSLLSQRRVNVPGLDARPGRAHRVRRGHHVRRA